MRTKSRRAEIKGTAVKQQRSCAAVQLVNELTATLEQTTNTDARSDLVNRNVSPHSDVRHEHGEDAVAGFVAMKIDADSEQLHNLKRGHVATGQRMRSLKHDKGHDLRSDDARATCGGLRTPASRSYGEAQTHSAYCNYAIKKAIRRAAASNYENARGRQTAV